MKTRLLVSITAASGGGKSTLERALEDRYGGGRVRTITTRAHRPDETTNDYDFRNQWWFWIDRFASWVWCKNLLWVVRKHGNLHATDMNAIGAAFEQTGWLAFIIITPERHQLLAHWCRTQGVGHITVHLQKPSDDVLRERLNARPQANPVDTERRIRDSRRFEQDAINVAATNPINFIEPGSKEQVLAEVIALIDKHAPN